MIGNILQLDFNYKIFLGVPIIVAHMFWGKYIYLMSTVLLSFNNFTSMKREDFCEYFEWKTKRINRKDIFFHSLFCSYSLRVPIIVEGTVYYIWDPNFIDGR